VELGQHHPVFVAGSLSGENNQCFERRENPCFFGDELEERFQSGKSCFGQ
jgi:hypothetical protein